METIFHDVPPIAETKLYDRRQLEGRNYSRVLTQASLNLVDLSSVALKRLGYLRTDLIDTFASEYPVTQSFAAKVHAECPGAQGMFWTSRQHDTETVYVLFGDRVVDRALLCESSPQSILIDEWYHKVLSLADRLGVLLVDGLAK